MKKQDTVKDYTEKSLNWITFPIVCVCSSSSMNTQSRSIVDESLMLQWHCYWCVFVPVSSATAQMSHLLLALIITAVSGIGRFQVDKLWIYFHFWENATVCVGLSGEISALITTFQNTNYYIAGFRQIPLIFTRLSVRSYGYNSVEL